MNLQNATLGEISLKSVILEPVIRGDLMPSRGGDWVATYEDWNVATIATLIPSTMIKDKEVIKGKLHALSDDGVHLTTNADVEAVADRRGVLTTTIEGGNLCLYRLKE